MKERGEKILVITLSIYFLLLVNGCSEETTEKIQERNGLAYLPNETEPFTGVSIKNYPNGEKKSEVNYKDGKYDGLFEFWYENGKKETERSYKDGELDGLSITWFENGQKKVEANHKKGKYDGLFTSWKENGQKEMEIIYKDGESISDVIYKKNGEIMK